MMDRYLLSKRANSVIRGALIAVVLIAGLTQSPTAWAQSAELDAAFEKYEELKKQGKFAEAIPFMRKFIELAKDRDGQISASVSKGLAKLGELLSELARFEEAEPVLKKSLNISEKHYGAGHSGTIESLNKLAQLYLGTNNQSAAALLTKISEIIKKAPALDHLPLSEALATLALSNFLKGNFKEAGNFLKNSLAIREKYLGPNAKNLSALGSVLRG